MIHDKIDSDPDFDPKKDYTKIELVALVVELRERLHVARTKIYESFEPETVDIEKLRSDPNRAIDVLFYSCLPDVGKLPKTFLTQDGKYPVLVILNGVQISFRGALETLVEQHERMLHDEAVYLVEEKLGTKIQETFQRAQEIADDAVEAMAALFPHASRREDRY